MACAVKVVDLKEGENWDRILKWSLELKDLGKLFIAGKNICYRFRVVSKVTTNPWIREGL